MRYRKDTASGKKTDRRKLRSDNAIRKAFSELITEKEFEKVTVKELCERADIDRKTFYLRFSSIDDFIDYLLREEMQRVADCLAETKMTSRGTVNVSKLFDTLSNELAIDLDKRAAVFRHVETDKMIARLKPILTEELAQRDALGLADDLGPYLDMFVAFFCAGILSLYRQWAISGDTLSMNELTELTNAAIAGGILSLSNTAKRIGVGKNARSEAENENRT